MDKASLGPRKVLRAPALRRGREIVPISDRVKLEKVLGLTVSNNSAFDCDPNSGIVAYPAGCVVVIYNVRKNKQSHILSSSKKTITSLAFSWDGKYLATGECGHQPHVRVWDVQEKTQIAEFQGHKFGINCVAFSPNLKYVVSVGSQHDMIVNVWDWKNNVKVASNKVSCKVKALSFASNGNYFVTVGNRHVKFWYLESSRSSKYKSEPVPLMGRSAILGDQRNNYFCDVSCGKGEMLDSTYAITKSGLLCEFNSRRLLDKWVELRTSSANSIAVSENLIIIGCSEGVIRCFSPFNLNYISTLPRPHVLGVDIAKGLTGNKSATTHVSNGKYPDSIAIALDELNSKITCVYNDHSLYVWDIKDFKKVGKSHSFLYHSACIWGIEVYPDAHENEKAILPKGTFLTCSSDDTVRFWNLESNLEEDTIYHRNIYSTELLKILYIDPELSYLCDTELNSSGSNDKVDTTYDGKNGVRCLRISPDGKYLASGDRSGNIWIHDLEQVEELCKIEAHDSEVLCLEYSKPVTINSEEKKYLASASRDRLIHVFDVKQDYSFQQTLDDHSSSITAVRFVQNGDGLQMISCGADKSIIFRKATFNPQLSLLREHHVVGKTTLYDMEVDSQQKNILTACQDRNIRVYSVTNGKHVRCFRGSQGEDGTLIKVVLDPSGTYIATSCTDKSLYLYDYISGECLATMFGHSELVTGLKFSNDGRHLISVSGDGCIFMWKLPVDVTQTMLSKQLVMEGSGLPSLWQDERRSDVALKSENNGDNNNEKANDADLVNHTNGDAQPASLGYRFSIGQLPLWAKKQMMDKIPETSNGPNLAPILPPRGRWAQRFDAEGLVVRSYLSSDAVLPFPNPPGETENPAIKTEENANDVFNNISESKEDFEVSEQSVQEILNGDASYQSNGSVTLRRSNNPQALTNRRSKVLPSGDSDIRVEDLDAEDERSDSEISEMVYYPASEDGSDIADISFQVCANNDNAKDIADQLKKVRMERMLSDVPTVNAPDPNSDDDEVSTPVDSDRSFLSSLCISTENLERLGQREKFMKSNYESLERGDSTEGEKAEMLDKNFYRQSISAKFLAGSLAPFRRAMTNGVSKPVCVPERQMSTPTRKREELMKALNDAKKTLETVGYRSGLSSSKSTADLHSTPDLDSFNLPRYKSPGYIRKVSSMIDLSPSLNWSTDNSVFSPQKQEKELKNTAPLWNQSKMYPEDNSPPESPTVKMKPLSQKRQMDSGDPRTSSESVSRSNSSSTVCCSTPRTAPSPTLHKTSSMFSLDRTSPSYHNSYRSPARSTPSRSSLPALPSKNNSSSRIQTSQLATDSSSDSSLSESSVVKNGHVVASPRPFGSRQRYFSFSENQNPFAAKRGNQGDGFRLKSRSEWDLKNGLPDERTRSGDQSSQYLSYSPRRSHGRPMRVSPLQAMHSTPADNVRTFNGVDQAPFLALDPSSVPLTPELCDSIADNLSRISSFAMQIFQRLKTSTDISPKEKCGMTNTLAQSIWQAQQILQPAPANAWTGQNENSCNLGQTFPALNGNSLEAPQAQSDNFNLHPLLERYSEQLLSMFEQRILNSQEKPNK